MILAGGEGLLTEAYRQAGYKVWVKSPGSGFSEFGRTMLEWSRWKKLRVAIFELVPYALSVALILRKEKVDILHVNDVRGALVVGLSSWLLGIPLVIHIRGSYYPTGMPGKFSERVCSRFITVCDHLREKLPERGRLKAVTVYNGIKSVPDRGMSFPWLEEFRAAGGVVISCFASLIPYKGHTFLIAIGKILKERGLEEKVRFLCVGDFVEEYQEYQQEVWAELERSGVTNITFCGWQGDPFSFYLTSDVTVLVSVNAGTVPLDGRETPVVGGEGFPRTHLEAMQYGLPVVSFGNAGVPEQVADGQTGFVLPCGDIEGVARRLEQLVLSPALRKTMGDAGRERVVKLFSTRAYIDGVVDVYRDVTRKR